MSKITSKLQLTLPKALAEQFHLVPGDEVTWQAAGEALRLVPSKGSNRPPHPAVRLKLFDAATERQDVRNKKRRRARESGRGWSREELYDRGLSR